MHRKSWAVVQNDARTVYRGIIPESSCVSPVVADYPRQAASSSQSLEAENLSRREFGTGRRQKFLLNVHALIISSTIRCDHRTRTEFDPAQSFPVYRNFPQKEFQRARTAERKTEGRHIAINEEDNCRSSQNRGDPFQIILYVRLTRFLHNGTAECVGLCEILVG